MSELDSPDRDGREMLRRLLDPPGPQRDECEMALLELGPKALEELGREGALLPTDVSPILARRLFAGRPESLLSWALASSDESFREITANFQSEKAIPANPSAGDRERAFVVATAPDWPELATLKAGMSHSDPLVAWAYLQRASRVPDEHREEMLPDIERLALHHDEYLGEEAGRIVHRWVGFESPVYPRNEDCVGCLGQRDTRLAALRKLILAWSSSDFPSGPALLQAACKGLEEELEEEEPRAAVIRAGLRFLEKTRNPNDPEPPVLAQLAEWRAPAPSALPAEEGVAAMEARLWEQMGPRRAAAAQRRVSAQAQGYKSQAAQLRQERLDEALRDSLKRDRVNLDDFKSFGADMVNVFLRLRLSEPEVWTDCRLSWAMPELLDRYPAAEVEPQWILDASKEGLSYKLGGAAILAGRRDKRVLPALRERVEAGEFREWELEAYARLAPHDEVVRTLRPLWNSEAGRCAVTTLALLSPSEAEAVGREMLDTLKEADPTVRARILDALPGCPGLAAESRKAVSDLGLSDPKMEDAAFSALRELPDGPESHPLVLSMLRRENPSWWALVLLVRGNPTGREVASGLLAYLVPQNRIYEHERLALDHLARIIDLNPELAAGLSNELKERFRPTPVLIKLACTLRPDTLPLLTASLTNPDPDVVEVVTAGFHAFADQDEETVGEAVTALQQALEAGPEHRSLCYMICALGHLQPQRFPELTAQLKSSFLSPRIIERRRAADVMASWGHKAREVAPLLRSYAEKADPDACGHLGRALNYIGG